MQLHLTIAVFLACTGLALAVALPIGFNDVFVLTIGVTGLVTYQAAALALNNAIIGAISPAAEAVVTAVGQVLLQVGATTTSLEALGAAEVGILEPQIVQAYLTLLNAILPEIQAASALTGFLTTYGHTLDNSLTAMVIALNTAANGTVSAIAADGAQLKATLSNIHVFYNLTSEIFSHGSI